ncbi:MAG: hypothetical protein ACLRFI_04290 [Alphaproteobacteria bacterium]
MTESPIFKQYCNEKGTMYYPKYYVGWLTNGNPNTNWPRRFFRHKFETKANQNLIHSITKINHAIAQNNWQVKALVSYACSVSEYPESAKLTLNQPQVLNSSPSELGIVTSCIFIDDKGNEFMNDKNWVGCCKAFGPIVMDNIESLTNYYLNENAEIRNSLIMAAQQISK